MPRHLPGYDRWRTWDAGARQRVSAFWRDHVRSDPELRRAVLTVELQVAGRVILLAREPLRVVRGSTGEIVDYVPGLEEEPEITQGISPGNQAAAARSVQVSFPAFLLNANAAIRAGHSLAGVGEIALQVPGGDYDLRWVLLRGPITSGLSFGDRSEVATAVISDPRDLEGMTIPPMVVDEDAWPLAQDDYTGQRIPRVYNGATAVPAPRVLHDANDAGIAFAVADTPDALAVSEVWRNGDPVDALDATHGWSETTMPDGHGRPVLAVQATDPEEWDDRDALNVSLTRRAGTPPRSVLWIARELMSEFGLFGRFGLNLDLWAYAETRIGPTAPHVMINASGADAPGVLEYVEDGLLASYPMIHLAYAGAGLGAAVIERRVGPGGQGVVGSLVGGEYPLLGRASLYTAERDIYTDFEVRYGYDPMSGAYRGVVRRTPANSRRCALAEQAVQGRRTYPVIESRHIVSRAEAEYVIEWLVAHNAVPRYRVEWDCSPWVAMRYRPGDLVWYTDPENDAFVQCPANVISTTFRRGAGSVVLLVWPRERARTRFTDPAPPVPPDPGLLPGYGDLETAGMATGGPVETGGM